MKKPTEIVKSVYHEHIAKFGEPSRSYRYENTPSNESIVYPSHVDVMVWDPEEDFLMTTLCTIGMSAQPMNGVDYRVELHMSIAEEMDEELVGELTVFLANLSLYPFMYSTFFDWWHTLPNVGNIPGYSEPRSLLLHPAFVKDGWDLMCTAGTHVKILNVIPITNDEQTLSKEKGVEALINYLFENEISYFDRR